MLLFVVAIAAGFVLRAFVRGPRPPIVLRGFGLLGAALCGQALVVPRLDDPWRAIALVATVAAGLAWIVWNIVAASTNTVRIAFAAFAVGAAMNAVPIIRHGSMPVQRSAVSEIGHHESENTGARGAKHVIVDDATFLGDRYAVAPLGSVVSLGDFVALGAIALLISALPMPRRRTRIVLGRPTPSK